MQTSCPEARNRSMSSYAFTDTVNDIRHAEFVSVVNCISVINTFRYGDRTRPNTMR